MTPRDPEKLKKRLLFGLPYGLSVLFAAMGLPMALGMVDPNPVYGVRTARTMADPAIWYAANTTGGTAMVVLGLLSLVIVYLLHRFWGTDSDKKLIVPIFVPVVFTCWSAAIALSHA